MNLHRHLKASKKQKSRLIEKLEISSQCSSNKKNKSYKEICYSSMHFFILFVILIFVSESSGLFSLCYCVFCLISMFQATKILKNERNLRKYLKLLQYFLIPLMCFEILLQTLYQIPFHNYLSKDNED